MKRISIFLLVFCLLSDVKAQYTPFSDAAARWFVADTYPHGNLQNPSFLETTTDIYRLCGDEEIDGVVWSRLCSASDSSQLPTPIFQGWVRDSVVSVFFMDSLGTQMLLYDFSLEVGDSILSGFDPAFFPTQIEYMTVMAVDSVLLSGQYRKRIFFDTLPSGAFSWFFDVWIEGIGSIHGPLSPSDPMFFGGESPYRIDLSCYWQEDELVWQNPLTETCYVQLILGLEDVFENRVSISPNPSTSIFHIQTPQRSTYRIYDLFGRIIQEGQLDGASEIDITDQPNGIYLLALETENGMRTTKLVKQ